MTKQKKTALITAAILVGLYLIFTLLSQVLTYTRSSINGTNQWSFMLNSAKRSENFESPSRIAIVTPPTERRWRYIQAQTAQALRTRLSKTPIACNVRRGQKSWSYRCPKVAVFESERAANKQGYSYMVLVEPQMWQYSIIPFSRSWKVEMAFQGGGLDTPAHRSAFYPTPYDHYGNCGFDFTASPFGKMTGIFSTAHLTKTVAQHAADDLCDMLQMEISNHAGKVSKGQDPNPQWRDSAPSESTATPADLERKLLNSMRHDLNTPPNEKQHP